MSEHPNTGYTDPVKLLLTHGDTGGFGPDDWPDYLARFGFGPAHIPDLIRMATDLTLHDIETETPERMAPVHAWRALAQLRAEDAIEPLLALRAARPDSDAICEDVPVVAGLMGPVAIRPLIGLIVSEAPLELGAAPFAIDALVGIVRDHPESRDELVAILHGMLDRHAETAPTVNGYVIATLMDLGSVVSIDRIRAAFAADTVDLSITGEIFDVEVAMGLRELPAWPRRDDRSWFESLSEPDDVWNEPVRVATKIGRNEPCPCGSGKKYKKCCLD